VIEELGGENGLINKFRLATLHAVYYRSEVIFRVNPGDLGDQAAMIAFKLITNSKCTHSYLRTRRRAPLPLKV
jgi:hypothetical protein